MEAESATKSQDFVDENEIATKRITDLMQEYLAIKKVERDVIEKFLQPSTVASTRFLIFPHRQCSPI